MLRFPTMDLKYYLATKKQWSSDVLYNLDEPWHPYVKWKIKGNMLYDSMYTKYPE